MKAIIRESYGSADVLQLVDTDRPNPHDDEVLIRVRGSSINRGDRYVMQGSPLPMRAMLGLFGPRQPGLGMDFSGEVVEVGSAVTNVNPGDAVYGQVDLGQTWAEYACVPANLVAPKPSNLTREQAGAVAASAFTALQGLRDQGHVQAGTRVLINGSTGAVGTFAVQIARALGAGEITAVCSERNRDLVLSLGADTVIPYETEDYLACGRTFDVMFDVVGNHSLRANARLLEPDGIYVSVGAPEGGFVLGPLLPLMAVHVFAPFVTPRVGTFTGTPNRPDLLVLTEMIEAGQLTPSIDRTFDLADTAEAMRFQIEDRPAGKVAIRI